MGYATRRHDRVRDVNETSDTIRKGNYIPFAETRCQLGAANVLSRVSNDQLAVGAIDTGTSDIHLGKFTNLICA